MTNARAARLAVADTVPERLKPFAAEGGPTYRDAGDLIADPRVDTVSAVTSGQEPPVTGAAALETMRLLYRIYDSAAILRGTAW
jgi:hypothetical protein